MFNRRREQTVSGFLIDPTKQSRDVKDTRKDSGDDLNRKASLSGPLVPGPGRTRARRECNDPLMVSTRTNLSKLSGLVAARTASSEDQQEKAGPSQPLETTNNGGRFLGLSNEADSTRKQDRMHHSLRVANSRQVDDGKTCTKEANLVSFIFH